MRRSIGICSAFRRKALVHISILLICPVLLWADVPGDESVPDLRFSLVQFETNTAFCANPSAFRKRVEEIVHEIITNPSNPAGPDRMDLIVFPEYISALLGIAFNFGAVIDPGSSTEEALLDIVNAYLPPHASRAESIVANDGIAAIPALLRYSAANTRRHLDNLWGALARDHSVYIVAGTYFALDETNDELRNRMLVYGPDGTPVYVQDKVFLTPFEYSFLGLSPGQLDKTRLVEIGETKVALTICRDTFFDAWEPRNSDADVWFDIKANGTGYDAKEARLFETALPERITNTGVPLGGTACLTGTLFDFFWEGMSSIIEYSDTSGYRIISAAADPKHFTILTK